MTWYVSDDLVDIRGKDPNSQYRRKWCEARAVEPTYGEPLTCPQCGRDISGFQWLKPWRIRLTSSKYPDRISDSLPATVYFVVSERFMNAYKASDLRGIGAFRPLETVKVARNHNPETYPKYYSAEINFTTEIKINLEKSEIYGRLYDWKCSLCNPRGGLSNRIEKIVLDVAKQDKDIVRVGGLGVVNGVLMSQRFFDFVEEHGFTNFNLVDVSEFKFGPGTTFGSNRR